MENKLRYTSHIELANENNAHTLQILLAGENKKVLEVGPASGYITEALRERGCRVTCVESDPEAARVAGEFAEKMIVGDIETLDFEETFGDDKFDVVIFGDVLEHLVTPESVLQRVRKILSPDGSIVSSIPNVAHGSLRLALLDGNFRYTEIGLLDRTHLRFFTRESIAEMFHNAGFEIEEWRQVRMDPFGVEVGLREEGFPKFLVDALRADEEAMTYQFVVMARSAAVLTNGSKVTSATEEAQRIGWSLLAVEKTLREVSDREQEANTENKRLQRDLQVRTGELEGAHRRISDIEGSIGWRMLNRVRPYARVIAPRGSLRFRALKAGGKTGLGVMRMGSRGVKLITKPLRRGRAPGVLGDTVAGRPKVARLKVGCYGEHCWSVGGGTAHALEVLIPLARYFDVELLLPPGTPLRDRAWYLENLLIGIGDIRVRHFTPGSEKTYDVWLSVWNEKIWPAPTPKRFNMVFFPFVQLDGSGYTHIVNGEYSAKHTRERYHTDDVVVIPPCVNVEEWATGPKEGLILHCSRFALPSAYADKSHIMMIQAFKQLCDRGLKGWKLVLAGATIDEGETVYKDHLAKHSWGYPVEFATNLPGDKLRELFSRASVYWHATGFSVKEPAAQEHFGIVIVEGMAAGAVPVVFNSGGPPEIITSGENGYLFDTLEELSDYTWRLATEPDHWRQLSKAARERARFFSPQMVEERMLKMVCATEKVSIIIGTHNNLTVLQRAVESVLKHTPPGYELIVVNNASGDGTGVYLASLDYPHLKVIQNDENKSFAAFNNQGQAIATRDYVLYLNDDIEAFPGWIEPLIDTLDRNPKVGAVGSRLLYPDGRVQHDGKMFKKDDLTPYHVNMGGKPPRDESSIEVDALTAACLMVRRELGGYSEDYLRGYYEDTDLCMRIKSQGYALVLHRGSVLIHYHGMTMGRNQTATEEAQVRNRKIFLERWADKLPDLVYLATEKEIAGTEIRCKPVLKPEDREGGWPISRRLVN